MSAHTASMMRKPLVVAMLVALLAPGTAVAATAKEKELEARVAQLEAQVQALLATQQAQPAQRVKVVRLVPAAAALQTQSPAVVSMTF